MKSAPINQHGELKKMRIRHEAGASSNPKQRGIRIMISIRRTFATNLCLTVALSFAVGVASGQGVGSPGAGRPRAGGNEKPAIKSAYLGGLGEAIPPGSLASVTGCPQAPTDDGMPIDLNVQIDASSIRPEYFRVVSRSGTTSTPNCATLRPAEDANELSTILLAGPFVGFVNMMPNPMDFPAYVLIIGPVKDLNGNPLTGLVSPPVTIGPQSGPSLIRANVFLKPERPAGASPISIQLVWAGGVTGPFNVELGANQLNAIRIIDRNGNAHTPLAFDDLGDGDNFVELYIPTGIVPERIEVRAGFFFDPMNFPNPTTAAQVTWPTLERLQQLLEQQ